MAGSLDGVSPGKVVWLPMKTLVLVPDWTSKRALTSFLGGLCKIVTVEVFTEIVRVRCLSRGMYEVI